VVLCQELERVNVLIETLRDHLEDLIKALKGIIGMSAILDDIAGSMFNGFIPLVWQKLAPATLKSLANWMTDFVRRLQQYNEWIDSEPLVMWLSGIHIPESFLTAIRQEHCRLAGLELDKLCLDTKTTQIRDGLLVKQKPKSGRYIIGLYIEGARWDDDKCVLATQRPKELIQEMPIVHLDPVLMTKLKLRGRFTTPVYVTSNRKNAMGVGGVFDC
jgi:dynein heavy chain